MGEARRSRIDREEGFTLVFTALTVTMLMMFVAMTVDVGAGFAERRADQTAADAAAMAASFDVGDATKRDTVIRFAERSLSSTSSTTGLSDAALDWNSCGSDTASDADIVVHAPGASCVRFSYSRHKVWVKIPDQTVSYFSGAAGLDPITHSAAAVAERHIEGLGGILPFGINVGQTGHQCMRSDSGGNADFCDGPSSGNFGETDFSIFEDPRDCANSSGDDNRMQFNIANGVDHELAARGTDVQRADDLVCIGSIAGPANSVRKATGLTPQKFGAAIAHGFTLASVTYVGRFAQKLNGWWGASQRTNMAGTNVDSVGLWSYIGTETDTSTSSLVPESCRRSMFIDSSGPDGSILTGDGSNASATDPQVISYIQTTYPTQMSRARILLERCFTHYVGKAWNDNGSANWSAWSAGIFGLTIFVGSGGSEPRSGCSNVTATQECTGAVFTRADDASDHDVKADIQLSARFGYTPVISGSAWAGNAPRDIVRFRAVYLYRICGDKCTGSGGNVFRFDPGSPIEGNPSGSQKVGDLTAFVFPDNMLPHGLAGPDEPMGVDRQVTISLIR